MKKIQKFLYLEPSERYLLIETFLMLNFIRICFLTVKFPTLQSLLNRISRFNSSENFRSDELIDKIVWRVEVSTSLSPGGAKCLARALVVHTMMERAGFNPILQIGVTDNPLKNFQAHAWVEYEGKIIIGNLPDLKKYSVLHPIWLFLFSYTLI
jgi:Transglutaminase-like superfamily